MEQAQQQPQYTFVRDGQMYHTDRDTEALLRAAQRYDERETRDVSIGQRPVAEMVFDHGRETGRIREGSAYDHAQAEKPAQTRAQSQGISQ